jgi:GNAT superfamily N-acetyltransferase
MMRRETILRRKVVEMRHVMTALSGPSWTSTHTLHLSAGERVSVRLAGPSDADRIQAYVRQLSAPARYNRFFGALSELSAAELRRATHMNGLSRATLIAEIGGSNAIMIGELRYAVLSDNACEFSISVADHWRGRGVGSLMLEDLHCRTRGLGVERLVADVLRSNEAMLTFAMKIGFTFAPRSGDPRAVRIVKDLIATPAKVPCAELANAAVPMAV